MSRPTLRVLVTGAGTGLGRGVACRLAERGHRVVAGTLGEAEALDLRTLSSTIEPVRLDVTSAHDRSRVADLEIDVLVNNAGIGQAGPLRSVPMELLRRAFEVNVFGTVAMTQTVIPGMIERGRGRILVMSSVAGVLAGPMTGPYSMTKHALQAFASALRQEVAAIGIDVALINPGPFDTGFNDRMIHESLDWFDPDDAQPGERDLIAATTQRVTGAQADPDVAVEAIVGLVEAETTELVNLVPPDLMERLGH